MNAAANNELSIDYDNPEPHTPQMRTEEPTAPSRLDFDRVLSSLRNMAGISQLLRVLGAAGLVASMSMFLLQGWNEGNDVSRYLMLLTQTGLLAAAGFALSHGLKEARGARIFFGLALISVPANFTILGALIYSLFPMDSLVSAYPSFAAWQVGSVGSIGITLVGAIVALVPVTCFAYAVMARHSWKALSVSALALNALLLLPIRHSVAAAVIALCSLFYATHFVRKALAADQALKTPEGRFALATLFIPAGIVLVRCFYLYADRIESLMFVLLSLAAIYVARQAATYPEQNALLRKVLECASLPIAFVFAVALGDAVYIVYPSTYVALIAALAYSAMAVDVMRRTNDRWLAGFAMFTVCAFVSLSSVFIVLVETSAIATVLCIALGIAMLSTGALVRSWMAAVAGVLTIAGGCMLGFDTLAIFIRNASWIELSIFGAMAIVVGSALERHGVTIRMHLARASGFLRRDQSVVALDN